ncbi:hypothetical protein E4G67_00480 [Candidatus Bathyarchaeota archaeon]|nr:MAG: hypothetical protein E4G67_00480 [Candidatus Bathyarchaeota archaeon]
MFTKKLYGIDLDGICFDFMHGFCNWLEEKVGVTVPDDEEITSYYWFEVVDGLDKDTFWEEFHKFGNANGYRDLALLPGAKEGLESIIAAGHEVMYITNRPEYAFADTQVALERHQFPFRERLVFANGSKAPHIRENNVDVFIDDSPRTIAEIVANTEATVYCMDYTFNRALNDLTGYVRVYNWDEFLTAEKINVIQGEACGG